VVILAARERSVEVEEAVGGGLAKPAGEVEAAVPEVGLGRADARDGGWRRCGS
jgi:hypothetical protein